MIYLLAFLIVSFPLRLIIAKTTSYSVAIGMRRVVNILLYAILVLACVGFVLSSIADSNNDVYERIGACIGGLLFVIPLYYFLRFFFSYNDLYLSKHIQQLHFFILYLRCFRDDKKDKRMELRLLHALNNLFCTFEVGQPHEFLPSLGACRIYIGDDWKEQVGKMMCEAPIVLIRVNTSDNCLWEFEQCYNQNYLDKTAFWITDLNEYEGFKAYAKEHCGFSFPIIDKANTILYRGNDEFRQYRLKSKKSFRLFLRHFCEDKQDLLNRYSSYFYGRDKKAKIFFQLKCQKDAFLMDGVQRWNWFAFLLPEFFVIFNRVKYRNLIYLFLLGFDLITLLVLFVAIKEGGLFIFILMLLILFNVLKMILWGKNGTAMVWLSEKWESIEWFEKKLKENSIKGVFYCLALVFISFCYFLCVRAMESL